MLGVPLAFTVPFALVGLALLPVLYVLLRITPPRPERVPFPPLKLILDLKPKDETPASTPWWLLLLRLALAALVILAMAGPVWNPLGAGDKGVGPLVIALDDGWAAAPEWSRCLAAAAQRIEMARRAGRPVAVIAISDGGKTIVPGDGSSAMEHLRAIKPQPIEADRVPAGAAIKAFAEKTPGTSVVWIADGLERGGARAFGELLSALPGKGTLIADDRPVEALADPRNDAQSLAVRVMRSQPGVKVEGRVRALDLKGLTIGDATYSIPAGKTEVDARFDLPGQLRNDIARLELAGVHSAGAVTLLDARWKRRSVGIVSGDTADTDQPLLAPDYYLTKALAPFADVHAPKPGATDPIGAMLDERVNVLILADIGAITGPVRDRLSKWVDAGGLLVRFAGIRLSAANDDLVPVRLRRGGRVLGGSLSWEQPKALAAFEPPSPFVGLAIAKEVTVSRQVLAEPDPGLSGKTWAQLSDGTPLVTAAARGKGRVVLFHITADTTWSNLPISGLFVDMLKKIVALSGESARAVEETEARADEQQTAVTEQRNETAAPSRTLDGFGTLGSPAATAKPVPVTFAGAATADHPPGFYGPTDALIAVNTLLPQDRIAAADLSGLKLDGAALQSAEPIDLRPWMLAGAFLLFLLDGLATLWLAGKLGSRARRTVVAASIILALGACFGGIGLPRQAVAAGAEMRVPAKPQPPIRISPSDLASALSVRLAYVISGDAKVDEISRQGLTSLSTTLAARTSLSPGDPVGIDPGKDELAFYPILYWPVVATNPQPSQTAIEKITAYMHAGGTIVFDTRDALSAHTDAEPTAASAWLRQVLSGVDVPELEPIPGDHVVTKTFYLIDNFIGRYTTGRTWIEALPPPIGDNQRHPARSGDGVSPIILTSNDLAAGWAGDDYGEAIYPLVPGDPRQHELALRGGINLVMYTLTGNYKADQVHVRDLLERLGH